MANDEQLNILMKGPDSWNNWMSQNTIVKPDFTGADLQGVNLGGAFLSSCNFSKANLSKAIMVNAELIGADLGNADLRGANLFGAELSVANLDSADLRGADLRGADLDLAFFLETANLQGAKYDRHTVWPGILTRRQPEQFPNKPSPFGAAFDKRIVSA